LEASEGCLEARHGYLEYEQVALGSARAATPD
jgi:hypothetical protein